MSADHAFFECITQYHLWQFFMQIAVTIVFSVADIMILDEVAV